ncbi:hypothetical protein JAAARDRAFT_50072 [Jaapia argillacea MUCL 33604]|uniref:Uncharacterized protein n=1 Tax=Jaapia argillacea MUCL 33604 TaxID=933084 RepID=A0A067PG71_9AGAM|nr:hypothetical protein JAAARDRAFT_50072 [Jaapia argillacea MUCL 33604]
MARDNITPPQVQSDVIQFLNSSEAKTSEAHVKVWLTDINTLNISRMTNILDSLLVIASTQMPTLDPGLPQGYDQFSVDIWILHWLQSYIAEMNDFLHQFNCEWYILGIVGVQEVVASFRTQMEKLNKILFQEKSIDNYSVAKCVTRKRLEECIDA